MAQVLIAHVEKLAHTKHERKRKLSYVEKTIANKESENENVTTTPSLVTFTVGSPNECSQVDSPASMQKSDSTRKTSVPEFSRKMHLSVKSDTAVLPIFHQSNNFTPKRNMFTPTITSLNKLADENPKLPSHALVSTEFVAWCSARFTEPILDMLQGVAGDGLTDRIATSVMPSDWALHTVEGLEQTAKQQIEALNEAKVGCDRQIFCMKNCKDVKTVVWSHLRPHLYSCDGRYVNILRFESQNAQIVRRFDSFSGNSFVDDVVCDLHIINGMTRELLLVASDDGLIRVWDPCYSIHSHDFEGDGHMITAAFLLKDLSNLGTSSRAVYEWNQGSGTILASGNIRFCRLWDVHAEMTIQDISIGMKNCCATKLFCDEMCREIVAVGLDNGSIMLFDPRVESASQKIMHITELIDPVVGLSLVPNLSDVSVSSMHLLAGSFDGEVRLWDPRVFKDSLWRLNINQSKNDRLPQLVKMDVQRHAKIFACATSSLSLKFYDIFGKKINEIQYGQSITNGRKIGVPTALRFHHLLASVAIAARERLIAAYGVPLSI